MKEKSDKLNPSESQTGNEKENKLQGYPINPKNEDIYKNFQEEEEMNPEDISKTKDPNSNNAFRRKDLDDVYPENDLDIPGSELDDQLEVIGSEDEENNYYSIAGDDHIDLDEEQEENNI